MLPCDVLLYYGWPEGRVLDLACDASERLSAAGLQRDAVLVWLEQVRDNPCRFLEDPALAELAREVRSHTPAESADGVQPLARAAVYDDGDGPRPEITALAQTIICCELCLVEMDGQVVPIRACRDDEPCCA